MPCRAASSATVAFTASKATLALNAASNFRLVPLIIRSVCSDERHQPPPKPLVSESGITSDRLIGRAGRQMDLDLGFHLDDAGGDLDQSQPQRVELGDPPGRAPGHQCAQAPQQPIGAGVQEQTELVGGGLGTRGTVGGEVGFSRP
jgi:hypothetical protein